MWLYLQFMGLNVLIVDYVDYVGVFWPNDSYGGSMSRLDFQTCKCNKYSVQTKINIDLP